MHLWRTRPSRRRAVKARSSCDSMRAAVPLELTHQHAFIVLFVQSAITKDSWWICWKYSFFSGLLKENVTFSVLSCWLLFHSYLLLTRASTCIFQTVKILLKKYQRVRFMGACVLICLINEWNGQFVLLGDEAQGYTESWITAFFLCCFQLFGTIMMLTTSFGFLISFGLAHMGSPPPQPSPLSPNQ